MTSSFSKKNILLISPEAWGVSHVSKHHYAIELAKTGAHVYFLNPPSNAFSCTEVLPNLYLLDYKPKYKGLKHLPKFISSFLTKREVKSIEKFISTKFDILWNFDSSRFFNLAGIKNKLKICHIVDMAENIQRPLLAKTSDFCFCTSDYIKKELELYNPKVFKIHHGYSLVNQISDTKEFFDTNRLQVGFVGNLSRACIDWNVIFELVETHPLVQFNFIGSYKASNLSRSDIENKILERLENKANITLLGQKGSELLPNYFAKFDLLLCVYKIENKQDIAQHSNLHKIMEYLGSGKIVLTSYVDEYKKDTTLLEMTKYNRDIPKVFNRIISNLNFYNNQENQGRRISFALENVYSKQIKRITNIITNEAQ